jgi:hypothetical protein
MLNRAQLPPHCYCGHVRDEHGPVRGGEFPSNNGCLVEGCECIHFEQAQEDDPPQSDGRDVT